MINPISPVSNLNFTSKATKAKKSVLAHTEKRYRNTRLPIGNIYGIKINTPKSATPLENLVNQVTNYQGIKYDQWTEENMYTGCNRPDKKWVVTDAATALNRSLSDAINSNLTLVYGKNVPKNPPSEIETPDYGHNWARHANYIEINNRAIANMDGQRTNSSMSNMIKFLPLIPPSHDKWANCILVSQLYPNIWGDSWNNNGENSLYGIKLDNERLTDNIGYIKIGNKYFTPEEQVKAFNDLAHLRGLKTSFRMLVSEDQLKIGDSECFRWNNPEHVEKFIKACCKGIELGFDGIFFDSIKHIGGYDWENYAGVGAVPDYEQMSYILNEIRTRTGRFDLGFSGEKAELDSERYKNMGLNAGTSFLDASSIEKVRESSENQKYCHEFAWGPTVSDDNDEGIMTYDQRLRRISSSLFGYYNAYDKLPSFMQMHDLFPLNYYTNTHELMMANRNFVTDENSHINNLFVNNDVEQDYRRRVANEFAHCYDYGN